MPKPETSNRAQTATDLFIANTIIAPMAGYTWSRAMREAGYAEKTIDRTSGEVLGRLGVQSQIVQARAGIKAVAEVTVAEVTENARWLVQHGKGNKDEAQPPNPASVSAGNKQLGDIIGAYTGKDPQQAMQINIIMPDKEIINE